MCLVMHGMQLSQATSEMIYVKMCFVYFIWKRKLITQSTFMDWMRSNVLNHVACHRGRVLSPSIMWLLLKLEEKPHRAFAKHSSHAHTMFSKSSKCHFWHAHEKNTSFFKHIPQKHWVSFMFCVCVRIVHMQMWNRLLFKHNVNSFRSMAFRRCLRAIHMVASCVQSYAFIYYPLKNENVNESIAFGILLA